MRLCDEQVKHLHWSLQKKQDSSLYQAITKGDNAYSYLHILHAMVADISTHDDCNKGTRRKWAQKALHGCHPHDLYQQNVKKKGGKKRCQKLCQLMQICLVKLKDL